MSPELLDPERFGVEGDRPTKESDCYAFGMVIYEVGISVGDSVLQVLKMDIGIMRPSPVPQSPTGTSNHAGDLGRGSTRETGERDGPRIYRRIVGNCRKVLGRRPERATGRGRHSFLFEREAHGKVDDSSQGWSRVKTNTWNLSMKIVRFISSSTNRFGLHGDRPTSESDCYAFGMAIYEVGVSVDNLTLQALETYTCTAWPCPIPRHPTGNSNNAGDLGGRSTKETEEREAPRIYGNAVGNCQKVLLEDRSAPPDVEYILPRPSRASRHTGGWVVVRGVGVAYERICGAFRRRAACFISLYTNPLSCGRTNPTDNHGCGPSFTVHVGAGPPL